MKLEQIKNPHSKINQVQKKTKVEEKDDLIEKTKKNVIDKYGVRRFRSLSFQKKSVGKKYMQITAAMSGSGQNVRHCTVDVGVSSETRMRTTSCRRKSHQRLRVSDFSVRKFVL
jgi:4-diphosphocytidyl-2C-methyl-D-erythritol kinase